MSGRSAVAGRPPPDDRAAPDRTPATTRSPGCGTPTSRARRRGGVRRALRRSAPPPRGGSRPCSRLRSTTAQLQGAWRFAAAARRDLAAWGTARKAQARTIAAMAGGDEKQPTDKGRRVLMLFEIFGWAAAFLTFLTYYQKTMVRLRVLGVLSNIVLHLLGHRLRGLSGAGAACRPAAGEPVPVRADPEDEARRDQRPWRARSRRWNGFGRCLNRCPTRAATTSFASGMRRTACTTLVSGRVVFEELGKAAGPGELFG